MIAIENTRLFEAEQASKRELTEALEQQTATSQVLEVISSSPERYQVLVDESRDQLLKHAVLFGQVDAHRAGLQRDGV